MFGKLFGRKKKRDLFDELFPLSQENKSAIETKVRLLQKQMLDEKEYQLLLAGKTDLDKNIVKFANLHIDTFGWEKENNEDPGDAYSNKLGDFMLLNTTAPNGKMEKNVPSEIEVYRNWLRDSYVKAGGGLISCEDYKDGNIEAYESITKIPRNGQPGMDYIYFLNIRNYEEQLLYQIQIKLHEHGMTGMRDNVFMSPISQVAKVQMGELMKLYRKDPYDPSFEKGNRRNLSEMSEFDYLFPFHPLSMIRRIIRPRILESIKFDQ